MYMVRAKLFYLDQNQWRERGTGTLKLNVRLSDGEGPRLVMRKEAVFNLLLNVPIFPGMSVSTAQDPRYVRLSAFEEGQTVHYNLRVSQLPLESLWLQGTHRFVYAGCDCQDGRRAFGRYQNIRSCITILKRAHTYTREGPSCIEYPFLLFHPGSSVLSAVLTPTIHVKSPAD